MSKIAGAMFPSLLDAQTRQGLLNANPEQSAGLQRRMADGDKLYGVKPTPMASRYDRVPGLKRKPVEKTTKSWWER
jgi:hypothetical protein